MAYIPLADSERFALLTKRLPGYIIFTFQSSLWTLLVHYAYLP